ncbi:kelch domain-containing protein 4-like [Haliotis asinina]|uniref:kelch domain-containing protein 4-like n=1 Tax=Haliotis asinina TaxID=109174 RepID=UPI003531C1BD
MGKKNKKEKKGKGIEKTVQKTQKKAEKRAKKELAEKGEEDIESLIAEFQAKDKSLAQVIEEKCGPPSPRCNMSLTAHPEKDELIMFGGEYYTGNKMFLYNDLYFYNIRKNEWHKVTSPKQPPPRSAHQAVSLHQGGGQLWVFGGEFSSHTQSQFYHYKDLWVLHLKNKHWEMINSPGGPTSRSGHRMVAVKRQLIVFGGFHDNTRDYKYYNDTYAFNMDTYTWAKLEVSGTVPSPRSGHVIASIPDLSKVIVYGGYSKEKVKRDVDRGVTHVDMFALVPEGRIKDDTVPVKWRWTTVKQGGKHPSTRCGISLAVAPGNRAVLFGGVFDEDENDEQMKSVFYNDMYLLELEKGRWHTIALRGKKDEGEKKKRRKEKGEADMEEEAMEVTEENLGNLSLKNESGEDGAVSSETTYDDGIFKVTIGPQGGAVDEDGEPIESGMDVDLFRPSPRMNPLMTVKNGVLYMYGGIFEDGDKQLTLADFYSLDLNKLDEWKVIIAEDKKLQVWEESDSSDDDDDDDAEKMDEACGGEEEDDDDEDDDSDMDICFDDAPALMEGESVTVYFERTREYWMTKAQEFSDEEGLGVKGKTLVKLARDLCKSACSHS